MWHVVLTENNIPALTLSSHSLHIRLDISTEMECHEMKVHGLGLAFNGYML